MSVRFTTLKPDYFEALAELQYLCFPHVPEDEYYRVEHFESHYKVFPEGSFVALDESKVVGFASGLFVTLELSKPHSLNSICADGFYTNHDALGLYYYAVDLGVHPDYRKQGVGRRFYELRKTLVRTFNKRGIVAGSVPVNYETYRASLSKELYIKKVASCELYDATLSFQLNNGFEVLGLNPDYVPNVFDNSAVTIYWANPDYKI